MLAAVHRVRLLGDRDSCSFCILSVLAHSVVRSLVIHLLFCAPALLCKPQAMGSGGKASWILFNVYTFGVRVKRGKG